MLTRQQSRLLRFIEDRLAEGDVSPSFEEMRLHLGLRSKSGVHLLLEGLRERGFVMRRARQARSLRIVRPSERGQGDRGESEDEFEPQIAKSDVIRVAFLGKVAAGLPIEAIGEVGWSEERECPKELLGRRGRKAEEENRRHHRSHHRSHHGRIAEHYALRVEGDSMVEAGILDGDTVIVEACKEAMDGELVIALVDDGEATLKILRREGGEVVLEAANAAYEAQRYEADRVCIQGRVTGLMRRYPSD